MNDILGNQNLVVLFAFLAPVVTSALKNPSWSTGQKQALACGPAPEVPREHAVPVGTIPPTEQVDVPTPSATPVPATVRDIAAYGPDQGLWLPPQEETMGLSNDDMLALFGSTERDPVTGALAAYEVRLDAARGRYAQAVATGVSILEQAGQARADARKALGDLAEHIENHRIGVGGPAVAPHTHVAGGVAP